MKSVLCFFFLTFLALFGKGKSDKVSYHGDKVFRIRPTTLEQLVQVKSLVDREACFPPENKKYSYWKRPSNVGQNIDVHVRSWAVDRFVENINASEVRHSIHVDDVQSLIDKTEEFNDQYRRLVSLYADDLNATVVGHFSSHQDINNWMKWVCKMYPKLATCGLGGISWDNRQIDFIKLGSVSKATKPAILIFGGIHAREWLSPATLIYIINRLVTTYKTTKVAKYMLDNYDWYILPVINPDGYEYTRTKDRLWRKTRSTRNKRCVGVDGNRNFGFHWKSSWCPCSEEYSGPKPFSEPETMSMEDFLKQQKIDKLLAFFSIHTYSKLWMLPYGYTSSVKPSDYDELLRVANIGKNALQSVGGQSWRCGNIVQELYVAAGNTVDYYKGAGLAKYSYVLELRGDGFVVPETEILPSGKEVFEGLTTAVFAMKNQ